MIYITHINNRASRFSIIFKSMKAFWQKELRTTVLQLLHLSYSILVLFPNFNCIHRICHYQTLNITYVIIIIYFYLFSPYASHLSICSQIHSLPSLCNIHFPGSFAKDNGTHCQEATGGEQSLHSLSASSGTASSPGFQFLLMSLSFLCAPTACGAAQTLVFPLLTLFV